MRPHFLGVWIKIDDQKQVELWEETQNLSAFFEFIYECPFFVELFSILG